MNTSSHDDDVTNSTAPLIEHLKELRQRLIISSLAFVVTVFTCFFIWKPIFNFLTRPICSALAERGQECALILIKLQEGFFVAIKISLLGGFVLAFPVISYQLWRFVAPGLYKQEKYAFLPFLLSSPFMFLLGSSFAFFIVTPLAFDFFLNFQQITAEGNANSTAGGTAGVTFQGSVAEYLSLTVTFIIAFGLCFQLPVLLTLLGKAELVSAKGLSHMRKYAVVAILVMAGIVTPPDLITQIILFTAVYGLYEISIQLVAHLERKREAKLRKEGLWFAEDEDG